MTGPIEGRRVRPSFKRSKGLSEQQNAQQTVRASLQSRTRVRPSRAIAGNDPWAKRVGACRGSSSSASKHKLTNEEPGRDQEVSERRLPRHA
jgi:hypothetical protein